MSRKPYSLSKQLVIATALALGTSGVALADDSSTNPSTENRGNLNMVAQSPCPQDTEASGTRQKKDEQKIESKTLPANRETPITSPSTYAGADYSALLSRLILAVKSVGL